MVEAGRPASELLHQFDPVPQLLKNVRFNGGTPLDSKAVKARIAAAEAELEGRGRLVIRKSGTEPLIRVMAEGDDPAHGRASGRRHLRGGRGGVRTAVCLPNPLMLNCDER